MNSLACIALLANILSAHQGEALRLSLPNEPGIQKVEIQWQTRKVPYVLVGEQWTAIVGVDLDVKPGDHAGEVLVTRNGIVERRNVTINVEKVAFPTTQLKVDDAYVQLSAANHARAAREAKELDSIHNTITPAMLWTEPFESPIAGEKGTNFGHRRIFNGEPRAPHGGADLKATTGTPIHSANRGRVVLAKNLFFTGNTVIVDHGLGIYTLYAHLSRIDVTKGVMVERGQVVGLAGATGRVTGPHLHWGARVQNARVDPFSLVNLAW